jgi:hypothetical protein
MAQQPMMRRTGQQVKFLAVIYVIGAFLDWNVTKAYRASSSRRVPHHLDEREASRDSPPVSRSQIAQDGPKAASQDRSKMPINGR